jgi:hypothetical protein
VDQQTAQGYYQNTIANNVIEKLSNSASDPIAFMNAAKLLTGENQENLKYVSKEMKTQGLSKDEISRNLQDLYQIPKDKADAYTNSISTGSGPKDKTLTSTADNFGDAFKEARATGAKTFEWNGKQYTTALAPPPSAATPEAPPKSAMQVLSEGLTPKTRTLQEAIDFAKDTAPMFEGSTKRFIDRLSNTVESSANNLAKNISAIELPSLEDIKSRVPTFDAVQKSVESFISPNATPGQPNILTGAKEVMDTLVDVAKYAPSVAQWATLNAIGQTIQSYSALFISPYGRENDMYLAGKAVNDFANKNVPLAVTKAMDEGYALARKMVEDAPAGTKELMAIKAYLQYPAAFVKVAGPEVVQDTMFMGIAGAAGFFAKVAGSYNALKIAIGTEVALDVLDATFSGMGKIYDGLKARNVSHEDSITPAVVGGMGQGIVTLFTMGKIDAAIMRQLAGDVVEFTTKGMAGLASAAYVGAWSRSFINTGIDDIAVVAGNPKDSMANFSFNLNKMNTNAAMDAPISAVSAVNQLVIANFANSKAEINTDTNQFLKLAPPKTESQYSWEAPKLLEGPQRLLPAPSAEQMVNVQNTIDTISQTLQQTGIPADQANSMAIKTIGSELVTQINNNIATEAVKLDPNKVLGTDANGNPITISGVFGSLATHTPVFETESSNPSDVQHNQVLIEDIKKTLNNLIGLKLGDDDLVPQMQRSTETQKSEGLPFAEKPDISRLFNNDMLFGTDLTVPETNTQTDTDTDTTTKTRGELIYGKPVTQTVTDTDANLNTIIDPRSLTSTITAPQTQTATQLATENPTKTDIALKDLTKIQPQTQTLTQLEPVSPTPVPVDIAVLDPLTPTSVITSINPPSKVKPPSINPPNINVPDISVPTVTVTPTTPPSKPPSVPKTSKPVLVPPVVKKKKKAGPDLLADFAKGRKLALPLEKLMQIINSTQPSNVIPMENYKKPIDLEDQLKAAKAGGLMRLASGGNSSGATPGSNISIGPGDATYSPVANFVKGKATDPFLQGKYDLQQYTYAPPVYNPDAVLKQILAAAHGGAVHMAPGGAAGDSNPAYEPGATEVKMKGKPFSYYRPFVGLNVNANAPAFGTGGEVEEHNPQFFSEGGLNAMENRYVQGDGDGTSDSIPAMLANGEFVIPADVVSSLGNGSNDSGASILDEFLKTVRSHKTRANKNGLPPDSKGALGYLLEAKRKVRA